MGVPRKAMRLATGLARDRTRYPALRLRPAAVSADEALRALAIEPEHEHVRDYERAAVELFPALAQRARAVGATQVAEKLEQPELATHETKRLLYLLVRAQRPRIVFETGTFAGVATTFLLRALADGGGEGRLVSFDLPAYEPIPNAVGTSLPSGHEPGWIVPAELRDRLRIVLGDARETLPGELRAAGPLDVFVHDSLHTTPHMLFEFRSAWRALVPGGVLVSDDVFWNAAFWWFTRTRRVPFVHIGNMGLTRKRR